MGSILSRVRLAVQYLRATSAEYDQLAQKLHRSPGLPVPNPSVAYWAVPPAPIALHGAENDAFFSDGEVYADIVIIGSGLTGTAVARTLLDAERDRRAAGTESASDRPLRIVMLEARDACSGATARNGGHITPPLYHDYAELVKQFGRATAAQIIRFRLAHLAEFLAIADAEGLALDTQAREVQTLDVFFDENVFEAAKKKLALYIGEMPNEGSRYAVLEGDGMAEEYQLSAEVVGCITTTAGAIHPYRLVTGILARLLREYEDTFHLFTHTPCTDISAPPANSLLYTVRTPKGLIRTPHIVHATNGWATHLLEPMRGTIVPLRGTMTSQRSGEGLGDIPTVQRYPCPAVPSLSPSTLEQGSTAPQRGRPTSSGDRNSWLGSRSFIFYPTDSENVWDYLTQMPPSQVTPANPAEHPTDANSRPASKGPSPEPFLLRSLDISPVRISHASSNSPIAASDSSDAPSDLESDTHTSSHRPSASISTAQTELEPSDELHRPNADSKSRRHSRSSIYPPSSAELMLGGGLGQSTQAFFDSVGNADDSAWFRQTGSYLSGALGVYFAGWGREGRDTASEKKLNGVEDNSRPWAEGRVKAVWSGILGMSADGMPWVGRLPQWLTGRAPPPCSAPPEANAEPSQQLPAHLAAPGEWIAAGYTGEGMVHAWMSGKALAGMILGTHDAEGGPSSGSHHAESFVNREQGDQIRLALKDSESWLPKPFLVSETRWRKARIEDLLASFLPN
ncbi:hypothetical protein HGRIS_007300 [Hohenbuehelia grisea]|uniref:FAD dependent oxidoreductase domain-containing protein n=1 Tax=Hohenbuehelia grisea TaxID=104357 RepID=A0ABR3J4B7_9AGAR